MEKYEKPGERLVSKVPNEAYKNNYDAIFGKKESWLERREREEKEKAKKLLMDAGIIDDNCQLTEPYQDD